MAFDWSKYRQSVLGKGTAIPSGYAGKPLTDPPPPPGLTNPKLGEISPFAHYLKQYGIPAMGANPYQQWQESQFNPVYATYQAASRLAPGQNVAWEDFLNTAQTNPRQKATDAFRSALALQGTAQNAWLEDIGGTSTLNDLMQAVLANQYALPVARRMAGRLGGLEQEWLGQTEGGKAGQTFLSYIQAKYGL